MFCSDTVDEMEQRLTRHQYYITNLETLMRLLDNDQMTPDKINDIRDHIEYYVENNDEGMGMYTQKRPF